MRVRFEPSQPGDNSRIASEPKKNSFRASQPNKNSYRFDNAASGAEVEVLFADGVWYLRRQVKLLRGRQK